MEGPTSMKPDRAWMAYTLLILLLFLKMMMMMMMTTTTTTTTMMMMMMMMEKLTELGSVLKLLRP
jgi:hypothetical protein